MLSRAELELHMLHTQARKDKPEARSGTNNTGGHMVTPTVQSKGGSQEAVIVA